MRGVLFKLCFTVLLLVSNYSFAANVVCTPAENKIQNKNIFLSGVEEARATQIYFIRNLSSQSLWLDHPVEKHRSAHAGWSSYLRPGKWSAILVNRKNFELSCAVIQPGNLSYQDCTKAISVCVPNQATFDSKRKGSYWLAEDLEWDELLKALEKRGVQFNSKKA